MLPSGVNGKILQPFPKFDPDATWTAWVPQFYFPPLCRASKQGEEQQSWEREAGGASPSRRARSVSLRGRPPAVSGYKAGEQHCSRTELSGAGAALGNDRPAQLGLWAG